MIKLHADVVYPVDREPVDNGVVLCEQDGTIVGIAHQSDFDENELQSVSGCIVPGFVNAHCHLELSHMLGKVDTGTGLIPFIKGVVTTRDAPREVIFEAIRAAEDEMIQNGIVAVGDISNTTDTFIQKAMGRLRYYTFVEMFDFLQDDKASEAFDQYYQVYDSLAESDRSRKACVPHSPYSVSAALFKRVIAENSGSDVTVSIHNQEMPAENELWRTKTGDLIPFYESFGINLDAFEPSGSGSIMYALKHLDPAQRNLFVHNTLTTAEEVSIAHNWSDRVYWATCPNANLYIENRLPDYSAFIEAHAKVCIGTDSLTSNWQLSVLEEMKCIARFQSYVSFDELLKWATLNGAEALGFDDQLGSLTPGKAPGLVRLNIDPRIEPLSADTTAERLI